MQVVAFLGSRLPFVLVLGLLIWAAALGLAGIINFLKADTICDVSFLIVDCAVDGQAELKAGAYLGALGLCLSVLGINHILLRPYAIYPFLNFIFYGAVACILFDLFAEMPVKNFGPLYSAMFNSINAVIALSFLFFLTLVPPSLKAFLWFPLAAIVSYGQAVIGFSLYFWLQEGFLGATSIYIGFLIYAFGVFSIHIMSVVALVIAIEESEARPAPQCAADFLRKRMRRYGRLPPVS